MAVNAAPPDRPDSDVASLQAEIRALAQVRDALILAHSYQRPEVQDVADEVWNDPRVSRRACGTGPGRPFSGRARCWGQGKER